MEKTKTLGSVPVKKNSKEMTQYDYDNIVTSHSLSPVPLIYVHNDTTSDITLSSGGILADIAPTLLDIMKIKKPAEMTGHSLITGYKKS